MEGLIAGIVSNDDWSGSLGDIGYWDEVTAAATTR
jgi:hypothetical protein